MSAACVGVVLLLLLMVVVLLLLLMVVVLLLLLMHWCWLGVSGAVTAAAAGVSTACSGARCCLVPVAGTANTFVV